MSGNFLVGANTYDPAWKDHSTGGGTSFTLDYSGTTNATLCIIGGVVQEPGVDFTVAGTALTTTTSVTSGVGVITCQLYKLGRLTVPADNSVTTAKILNDAVTTAKIVNDAVTLAKLASGTDGELITWDASGDPAAVAVGTVNHVLTSSGAGAAPTFKDPGISILNVTKGGDIASADPLVIDTDGNYFDVTGTTGFAAMTVTAGRRFTLQFDGILTMTHHATNLDLPGEANITTAAGDVAEFFSTGSNTVQCVNYTKADGASVAAGGSRTLLASATASDDATVDFTSSIDSTYTRYEFHLDRVIPASDDVELTVKLYAASFQATNYNWSQGSLTSSWSNSNASGEVGTFITLGGRAATNIGVGGAAGEGGINGTITLDHPSDASFNTLVYGNGVYEGAGNAVMYWVGAGEWATTTAVTGIQFYFASGNVESGFFRMYGVS